MAINSKSVNVCFKIVSSARGRSEPPFLTDRTTLTAGTRSELRIDYLAAAVQDDRLRHRYDEAARPTRKLIDLRDDLILQIPGQNENVVGPPLVDLVGSKNRNSRSRQ